MMVHQNLISVFLSYVHEDEPLLRKLETHLSLLKRQGLISTWYDRQIVPGTNWAKVIDEQLEQASIILLLVSADFLASDYCYEIEMQRALERHKTGQAIVIPIAMRPADWKGAPFAHLQALPTDAKAITTWSNEDEAFLSVAEGIRKVVEELSKPLPAIKSLAGQNQAKQPLLTSASAEQGTILYSHHRLHGTLPPVTALFPFFSPEFLEALEASSPESSLDRLFSTIKSLAWSPGGTWIASLDQQYLHVWEVATGNSLFASDSASVRIVHVFRWLPEGTHLAIVGLNSNIGTSPGTHSEIVEISILERKVISRKRIGSVKEHWRAWSPDGTRIASTSEGTLSVWDTTTGRKIFQYRGYLAQREVKKGILKNKEIFTPAGIREVVWSPDGTRIASASEGAVHILDALSGGAYIRQIGDEAYTCCLAWSPDSTRFAFGSRDTTVSVWDAIVGRRIFAFHGHTKEVKAVAWSPDGTRIASSDERGTVIIWNAEDGRYILEKVIQSPQLNLLPLAWSLDGTRIAIGQGWGACILQAV